MPEFELPPLIEMSLRHTRQGAWDPTCSLTPSGYKRAMLTPDGPGVIEVALRSQTEIRALCRFHGPGAGWIEHRHRGMLGLTDVVPPIEAVHSAVTEAQRRVGQLRLVRTSTPYQDLLSAVLGQRITARAAMQQWRRLVADLGGPAPGADDVLLPPDPQVLAETPYHRLHRLGIERRRADALRAVASRADWLMTVAADTTSPPGVLTSFLTRIPGVGQWTAAVAGGLAFGDPDAVRVGDFHVKNTVSWALTGRPRGSDDDMLKALAPYQGQRERIVRWLQAVGWMAPRRGPGRPIVDIAHL